MNDSVIKEVLNAEAAFMSNPATKYEYDQREKELRDYNTRLKMIAKKNRAEGREEGREEGKKQGFEEATKKLAINLLINGIPIDIISKTTHLTMEQIVELKKELS